MGFTPPQFNLLCNIWTCDGVIKPSNGGADFVNVPCQKYLAPRGTWNLTPPWSTGFYLAYHPPVFLRLARTPPFDGPWPSWKATCIEVPAGSGQYYRCAWNDIQHEGFVNEYALFVGVQCNDELLAAPPAGATEAVGVGADPCGNVPPADPPTPKLPPGPWPPAPPAPGASFVDDFVDIAATPLASHVADSGETWTVGTGSLEIGPGGFGVLAVGGLGLAWATANYTGSYTSIVTMDFITSSAVASGQWLGVLFRAIDSNNWHSVELEPDGGGAWWLSFKQCVAGSVTTLANGSGGIVLTDSTMYAIRLERFGATVQAYLVTGGTDIANETFSDGANLTEPGLGVFIYEDGVFLTPLITALTG